MRGCQNVQAQSAALEAVHLERIAEEARKYEVAMHDKATVDAHWVARLSDMANTHERVVIKLSAQHDERLQVCRWQCSVKQVSK